MVWSYRKNARNKNRQSNTLLETHFKEANRKTKNTFVGRMMLKEIYRSWKCQIVRPLSKIEEDGRKWLRRPNLCTKSSRAVRRGRKEEEVWWVMTFRSNFLPAYSRYKDCFDHPNQTHLAPKLCIITTKLFAMYLSLCALLLLHFLSSSYPRQLS